MSGYAAEKLGEAVHDLALGAGRIKERLEKAAGSVAASSGGPRMPANLRAKYDLMWARLTAVAPRGTRVRTLRLRCNCRGGCLRDRGRHPESLVHGEAIVCRARQRALQSRVKMKTENAGGIKSPLHRQAELIRDFENRSSRSSLTDTSSVLFRKSFGATRICRVARPVGSTSGPRLFTVSPTRSGFAGSRARHIRAMM